jgi:hypothetical protein
MLFNQFALDLVTNIHTLEDTEVAATLKALIKECDRRFIDHMDIVEEAEEELEYEAEAELAQEVPDYSCADIQGW